jgi:colanic acid biosynthesis glycosyl transferase WcaI
VVGDRPDVVLTMTDPPLVGNVGYLVAKRFRCPIVVVSQDVFPEIAVELRRLTNPLAVRVLGFLIEHALRHADRVVAIGPVMRRRLIEKGARPDQTVVIPNWVDTSEITPRPHDNAWARKQGLDGRFVVMHSGNVGHARNLDVLLRALHLLDDIPEVTAVIVGFGARYDEVVELAATLRLDEDRVRFLPYQPRTALPDVLSTARVHFVGLPRGLAGYVVPSRVNGILAAGRPILAAVDGESETAALVDTAGCGVVVSPEDANAVAEALRRMAQGAIDLDAMGDAARAHAEAHIDVDQSIQAYHDLLRTTLR